MSTKRLIEGRKGTQLLDHRSNLKTGNWKRILIPAAIVLLAAVPRFVRLDSPDQIMILDEGFYVPEARSYIDTSIEHHNTPHPPLGKLFIVAGIKIFGDSPFGWRAGSALMGTLGVLFLYLLARRLWSSEIPAILTAVFLALDGLWLVQSRIAMLDVYATTFMLLGIWLLIEDRARTHPSHRGKRWWRIGSGAAFGLAIASKMTVVPFLLTVIVLALLWEATRITKDPSFQSLRRNRRRTKGPSRIEREEQRRYAASLGKQGAAIAGTFLLLPAALYILTFVPWAGMRQTHMLEPCEDSYRQVSSAWFCTQKAILGWNISVPDSVDGQPTHASLTRAWSWPWIGRPVTHFVQSERDGDAKQVTRVAGIPNPALWWPAFLVALPAITWWAVRKKDMTAALIVLFLAVGYLPYLLAGLAGHAVYLYHATIVLPFLMLALAHAFHHMTHRSSKARALTVGYGAVAFIVFAYFYPVLTAVSLPRDGAFGWRGHLWLTLDCAKSTIKSFCWL